MVICCCVESLMGYIVVSCTCLIDFCFVLFLEFVWFLGKWKGNARIFLFFFFVGLFSSHFLATEGRVL